jgi:hypothetical protein
VETFRRRQVFALAAAAAAAVLVMLLLYSRSDDHHLPASRVDRNLTDAATRAMVAEPGAGVDLDAEGWNPPQRVTLPPVPEEPASAERAGAADSVAEVLPTPAAVVPVSADFSSLASLCTDLARVVDTQDLPKLLERASSLLDASGIILWIADPDARELNPIMAQGYPPQLLNRLGALPRSAENATAAAFRTSLLQTVRGNGISNGAIAAPLVTASGCVGVMAAEVRDAAEQQDSKLAAAAIMAAQLATLVGPPAPRQGGMEAANG